MATISHVIRWADNTADLQRNLKQGLDQIEAVRKSAEGMAKSLSGDKLIQSAHNMAAAVQQIGGASKLTAAEQERVNTLIDKAIQKYQAMGQTAPKALLDLADATKKVEQPTSLLESKAIALGSAIGTFIGGLAWQAVNKLGAAFVNAAQDGAKFTAISSSFERLATSVGETGDAMLGITRTATKGLISDLDLMQSSNKAMLLGLPVTAQEMGTLSKAAVTLGRAMGQDATKSLDDLITALGRSSPLILDNLGLTVKVGEANEAYAKTLNKTANDLTDAEKKMAFYKAAMDAAQKKTEELGDVQLTLSDQISRVVTASSNVITEWVSGANEASIFSRAVGALADSMVLVAENMDLAAEAKDRLAKAGTPLGYQPIRPLSPALENSRVQIEIDKMLRERQGEILKNMPNPLAGALPHAIGDLDMGGAADAMATAERLTKQTDELARKMEQQAAAATRVSDSLFGRDVIERANQYASAIGNVNNVARLSTEKQLEVNRTVTEAIEVYGRLGQTAPRSLHDLAEATAKLQARSIDVRMAMYGFTGSVDAMAEEARVATNRLRGLTDDGVLPSARAIAITVEQIYAVPPALQSMDASVNKSKGILASFATSVKTSFKGLIDGLTGGNGLAGFFGNLGTGIVEGFGNILSGGISSLINKGISLAVTGLKKLGNFLFGGPSQKELEGRQVVAEFEKSVQSTLSLAQRAEAGGQKWAMTTIAVRDAYLATGRSALDAERDVKKLWESSKHGAEAAKAAADKINQAFIEQQADAERLEAAIQKYGFAIEELGPKFRAQKLNEQALELIEDWRVLVGSGIEVALVNDKMAESINGYLQLAMKTGAEVPFAMRPILQSLIDQGKLMDANGNLITDLGSSGVTFAETLTQGFDRVVIKLQQLIDTLNNGVGPAIENLPAVHIPVELDPTLPERFNAAGGLAAFLSRNIIPMAEGGMGTVTKPTLFLAGEGGPEQYAFSGANQSFGGGGSDPRVADALERLERSLRDIAPRVSRGVADALTQAPRLRTA